MPKRQAADPSTVSESARKRPSSKKAAEPAPADEEYEATVKAASIDLAASVVQSGVHDAMKAQAEEEAVAAPPPEPATPAPAPATPAKLEKKPSLLERAGTWLFGTPDKSGGAAEAAEAAPSAAAAAAASAPKDEEPELDASVSAMVSRAISTARDQAAAEEAKDYARGRRLSAETVAWLEKPQEHNGAASWKELADQQEAAIKVQAIARGASGRKAAAEIVEAKEADEASKAVARARVAKTVAGAPTAPLALVAFAIAADGRVLTTIAACDAAVRDAPPKRGFLETLGASMKSLLYPAN